MGRRAADVEINTFIRGLITEASPLTYPENASLSEANFVLNRDGSRQRRLGMDYEEGAVLRDTGIDFEALPESAISSFVWPGANSDGSLDILVVQVERRLYFFDNNREVISANLLMTGGFRITPGGSLTTTPYMTFGDGEGTANFLSVTIQKNLVIIDEKEHLHVISYDQESDEMLKDVRDLEGRDMWGIDIPELEITDRPTPSELATLTAPDGSPRTADYLYIMENQGWNSKVKSSGGLDARIFGGASWYKGVTGDYPSQVDVIWAAKDSSGVLTEDAFDSQVKGTTPAPIGSVVLGDIFKRGEERSLTSTYSVSSFPEDRTRGTIGAIGTYAGRVFYGIRETELIDGDGKSPRLGTLIFYSQVVVSDSHINRCYSVSDPTSEDTPGVVDSDGGFISIPDIGEVLSLNPLGDSLFVISTRGVWEVHGGDKPFSATNQNVGKVSAIGALSGRSVVVAENNLFYWSESGIYNISKDEVSLRGVATNISVSSIQSLYEAITTEGRATASAVYDPVARQIRWQYGEGLTTTRFKDKELILDIDLKAYYSSEVSNAGTEGPYIISPVNLSSTIFNDTSQDIVVGADQVVVGSDQVVASSRTVDEAVKGSVKYLSVAKNSVDGLWYFSIAHYRQAGFLDWKEHDSTGTDAKAHLLTGFLTAGVASKDKQTPYLVTHCKLTEEGFTDDGLGNLTPIGPSSCKVQAQWEWTNSDSAGRWGPQFEAYRLPRYFGPTGATDPFDYGFTVVTTKSKLRGKGRALSLLFETEEGKDLHLYGWGHTLNIEEK